MSNRVRLVRYASCTITAAAALLGAQQASAAKCLTAEQSMAEIMNTSATSDTLLLAHRGSWGKYNPDDQTIPENSIAAAETAKANCMDGIELDVKESKDGVLYLMHDFNLGRTTNIYQFRSNRKYNPMNDTGDNPAVSSVTATDLDKLTLLLPDRSGLSDQKLPRVSNVLETFASELWWTPIIFDTKTTSAVRMLDSLVKGLVPNGGAVMGVKVNATLYPTPQSFWRQSRNLKVIPVFTTNMLGKISVADAFNAWSSRVKTMEINVKQNGGLLSYQKDQALKKGIRVAVFQAIPDGPRSDSFYKNTGACCYKLSDLYYTYYVNRQVASRDTDDRRGQMPFLVQQRFGLITTDDPQGTVRYLARAGKRQTHFQGYWG
ncbi:glycerophosphodiester phosphodiesterase family protein [uncultured Sphingomonas sp.]|uniref:glycerophosphodiester phosphodiesterase family protein n=1 Tax=uncultured Sphingomonas sp. TaxID=158754 RepID=UPI0025DA9F67|nr:glycerophosphodiester phosphodiesterase family protein [uncultured Sphingomonas sp.]